MCIVFMSNTAPGYKLVLAANRDEFYDRPASQAAWHGWDKPEGDVLSGIDLSTAGGGTWLGMTRDLRIGVLTNIRPPTTSVQPPRLSTTPSRGALLKRCLEPGFDMEAFLATPNIEAYEGFNALFLQPPPRPRSTEGDTAEQGDFEIGYLSNKPPQARTLQLDGSRGLSNTTWDEPWPKVLAGQVQVDELARKGLGEEELIEGLFTLMSQSIHVTSPADAPRSIRIPTVLIQGREYGTRVTTVILVTDRDEVTFVEQTWLPEGLPEGEEWRRTFKFQAA